MKCTECNEEMKELTPPKYVGGQVPQSDFPTVMTCMKIQMYICQKCQIQSSKTTSKIYIPNPDVPLAKS